MKRVARIQKDCPICGKSFETTESLIVLGAGKYCSLPCRAIGAGRKTSETRMKNPKRIKKICETCGKTFEVYPSWTYRKNCSRECTRSERINLVCEECGKKFVRTPGYLSNGKGAGKFCSKKCAGSNLKGEQARHWQGGKIKRICKQCGKEFEVFKSKIDVGEGNFCSRKCSATYNQPKGETNPNYNRVVVNCRYCGKEILAKLHQLKNKNGNFCSKDCAYKWMGENLRGENSPHYKRKSFNCVVCGKEFAIPKNQEEKGRTKYCSQECYWSLHGKDHPHWTGGGETQYCEIWKDVNPRVHAFYGYKCVLCGQPENGRSHIGHHVFYVKEACCWYDESGVYYTNLNAVDHKENDYCIGRNPNYFVILCRSCHGKTNGYFANRKKYADLFKDMIDTYYEGKCYFTKEEYAALYP